ncbi:NAD(P)/FAD-dependent oxidoreductase [Halalkalicoccus jeotgali]|uniref:FAD-dependent pyridine nucleotide-disulfide oxidoreductase n=1 Tax=Halalkalicoccus jeotgali (strain DSM 18796 / CECT 7217 / JCM 14584 / KCTC 4019 / B3) TaxID=795797 RepID=D8J4X9_HALJB|nr:NAD(P)/FAD-dependent oxidoreductase [Halalkalicoccus jeotgali]ADJ15596.1 FAD-dependent pyridine nucleotide-disulfide oxidoreductase [Halalkalicoccus jeotgali B3]ELY36326.1 FAD-dependent pyridine nucleotide-disulfide oxidoreductase [Halalkalicoccus jeotgali B3]
MTEQVVVLGAGYAGAGAIPELENELSDAQITWISDTDYHLVLHESHRVIRDPSVRDHISIPVEEIKSPATRFIEGAVTDLDTDERVVSLADGTEIDYDYVLVALGSDTAYYGIPGLEEHSLTLKNLDDALAIHDDVKTAAREATREEPARIAIGGAGLSGIQAAGEVAEFRDKHNAPIEISLIEALPEIMPGQDPELQGAVKKRLLDADIEILTDDPITEADEEAIQFDEGEPLNYNVFVWTGGITGRTALENANVEKEHNRIVAESTFQTDDERVFAIGDSAIVDQGESPAPPTAQAAWQAAELVGENIARASEGRPLKTWTYEDKGTLISIGDRAVAHNVQAMPINTFGWIGAETLKKAVAARWIKDVSSVKRAQRAWKFL